MQPPVLGSLSAANIAAHTRNSRSQSPQATGANANADAGTQQPQLPPPRQNTTGAQPTDNDRPIGEGAWKLTQPVLAGETVLHLADYSGLAIGDVIELSPQTPGAEVVVVQRFGSIHLVSATRNQHDVGTSIRRLVAGTGERYEQHIADAERQRQARSQSRTGPGTVTSQDERDLDGFESHDSWSPRERQHQADRYKRRQRAAKLQGKQMPAQPNLLISVKQPDRVELEQWPQLPIFGRTCRTHMLHGVF